jgi:hypothetical protein
MKRFAFAFLLSAASCTDEAEDPLWNGPTNDSCAVCARASDAGSKDGCMCLGPDFQSETFLGCLLGSPLRHDGKKGTVIVVATGDGHVVGISPLTGKTEWNVILPAERGRMAHVLATPTLLEEGRLAVAWQEVPAGSQKPAIDQRYGHYAAVVDLERGILDPDFEPVELAGSQPSTDGDKVEFDATYALSRAALVHAPGENGRGYVYVTFGNARDLQPWHGWVFELDLDAWHDTGTSAAISATLVTTPETDCGSPRHSGAKEMRCGGGIWAPAGPEVVSTHDGFDLIVPTGNGALDPTRHDYAHTMMRVHGPGLKFEDRCDPALCADWDIDAPSVPCMQSCENLFIPRFANESTTFDVGGCADKPFFRCYAFLDWDLGSGSPAVVDIPDGPRAVVLPAKDGGLYLADLEKLGTLYDRLQVVEPCGSHGGACRATWAGMLVTKPEIAVIDGQPIAVVAAFNEDKTNAAGLVGVRVLMKDGVPRLERAWEAPSFDSPDAVEAFRHHPSRVRLLDIEGETHAAVVDIGAPNRPGMVYLVRVRDGAIRVQQTLIGIGQRFTQPLAIGEDLFFPSCVDGGAGPGRLEAWRIR